MTEGNWIEKQIGRGGTSHRLMLTERNLDVHIRKRWQSIGPGEITARYLRKA